MQHLLQGAVSLRDYTALPYLKDVTQLCTRKGTVGKIILTSKTLLQAYLVSLWTLLQPSIPQFNQSIYFGNSGNLLIKRHYLYCNHVPHHHSLSHTLPSRTFVLKWINALIQLKNSPGFWFVRCLRDFCVALYWGGARGNMMSEGEGCKTTKVDQLPDPAIKM